MNLASELESLVPVALRGMAQMHDERSGLFSHKAWVLPGGEVTNFGANALYTGACVVGLLSRPEGREEPYARITGQALRALLERHDEPDPAVLGTTLWGCALAEREEAEQLADRLIDVVEPHRASSMQLGLAITGLAQWLRQGGKDRDRVAAAARGFAYELQQRFIPACDVYAATGRNRLAWDPGVRLLTSFASQVYPVLGLCELAVATDTEPPSQIARVCDFLAESQGELGQWWWFYSTRDRKVIEGYPVYSMHQDAMAFMALLPATNLQLGDYRDPLARGIRWIRGANELGRSLVDPKAPLIYRAIQRPRGDADGFAGWSRRQRIAVYASAAAGRRRPAPRSLEMLLECRSYHLGWLLLAAGLAGGATWADR
jgi:hypothetical protein